MRSFEWDARDYAESASQQLHVAREYITRLKLKGKESLLDLGCGDGRVTAELAGALPKGQVVGLDNSPGMITLAKERYPRRKFPNLTFKLGDAGALELKDLDVVFSHSTLHWIQDHLSVLKRISSCLKPGGRVFLAMGGLGTAASVLSILDDMIDSTRWVGYFEDFCFPYGLYGAKEYKKWLKEAQLTARSVELVSKTMSHKGGEELSAWLRTTLMPYSYQVPESERQEFLDELRTSYLSGHPADENGAVSVELMCLEVQAAKPKAASGKGR